MFIERDNKVLIEKLESFQQRLRGEKAIPHPRAEPREKAIPHPHVKPREFNVLEWATILVHVALVLSITGIALTRGIGNTNAVIVGISGIFLSGLVLYIFRGKYRACYGLFEVISALALGGFTIARAVNYTSLSFIEFIYSPDSLATLLGLSSSIYIVVRGMDNISEARKKAEINKNKSDDLHKGTDESQP